MFFLFILKRRDACGSTLPNVDHCPCNLKTTKTITTYSMGRALQKDNPISCVICRKSVNSCVSQVLCLCRLGVQGTNSFSKASILAIVANRYIQKRDDNRNHLDLRSEIFNMDLTLIGSRSSSAYHTFDSGDRYHTTYPKYVMACMEYPYGTK